MVVAATHWQLVLGLDAFPKRVVRWQLVLRPPAHRLVWLIQVCLHTSPDGASCSVV